MLSDQRGEELAEAMQISSHWLRKPDTTPLNVHSPQLASANCLKHLHHLIDRPLSFHSTLCFLFAVLTIVVDTVPLSILCLHLKQPNTPHSATPFDPRGIPFIRTRSASITLIVIVSAHLSLISDAHLKVSSIAHRSFGFPASPCPTTSKVMTASKVTMGTR